MVTNLPKDGVGNHHPKSTRRNCTTDLEFSGWSPTIQNLPEGSVVQTLNLKSRHPKILLLIIQNLVTNFPKDYHSKNGHPQSQAWSSTNQNKLDLTKP